MDLVVWHNFEVGQHRSNISPKHAHLQQDLETERAKVNEQAHIFNVLVSL